MWSIRSNLSLHPPICARAGQDYDLELCLTIIRSGKSEDKYFTRLVIWLICHSLAGVVIGGTSACQPMKRPEVGSFQDARLPCLPTL
jgi:hypothetical protein